ncbi:MAG: rhodanese family protein [Rhizobiales bacterium]|nr:rhodanese family protein [Hyphomicrobiales bacterium]
MTLAAITAAKARELIERGAVLVDIRETGERARERIQDSSHVPLSGIGNADPLAIGNGPILFHCKSGARTAANVGQLKTYANSCEAYIVEGGMDALREQGLAVIVDKSQPIEMQRQVQIVAGSAGLLGTALGFFLSPVFYIVPAFVGAGLLFAGITGFCGMARILMRAPWNRVAAS